MILIFTLILTINAITFTEWQSKHHKHYSPIELLRRRAIFNQNVKLIETLKETLPYEISIDTPFSDLTDEEFAALHPQGAHPKSTKPYPQTLKQTLVYGTTLDYRKYNGGLNYVVEPSDQGTSCICSYAFAAISAIESVFLLQNPNYNPNSFALSQQTLIACSQSYQPAGSGGCNGGSVAASLKYAQEVGVSLLSDYPYTGYATACEEKDKFAKVVNYDVVETEGEYSKVKTLVTEKGPVVVHIDTTKSYLRFYKGGIFQSTICSETTQNHAVTIIGFGVEDGKEYFVCKNSWGTNWGESGYFRIRADKWNCGITAYVTYVDSVKQI